MSKVLRGRSTPELRRVWGIELVTKGGGRILLDGRVYVDGLRAAQVCEEMRARIRRDEMAADLLGVGSYCVTAFDLDETHEQNDK